MNGGEAKLSELYQEVILDHNKKPRNFGRMTDATSSAHGKNPLCGDDYFLDLKISDSGRIEKISFEGSGCAISKASSSMLTVLIQGKSVQEAGEIKDNFIHLLTDKELTGQTLERAGRLKIFEGVRQFPVRVKCAALIWRTLEQALRGEKNEVTTET